jgi:ATP-dependent Clp protease ATP-binding subunit ClpA
LAAARERENLRQLAQAHKIDETIALVVGRDDIETVVTKLTGLPVSAIRESLPPSPTAPSSASE